MLVAWILAYMKSYFTLLRYLPSIKEIYYYYYYYNTLHLGNAGLFMNGILWVKSIEA